MTIDAASSESSEVQLPPVAPILAGPSPAAGRPQRRGRWSRPARAVRWLGTQNPTVIFVLSLFTGLVASAVLIVLTTAQLRSAWGSLFTDPGHCLSVNADFLGSAYYSLFKGSIFDPAQVKEAFAHPSSASITTAATPIGNSVTAAVPLIIGALGLAVAFRAGMFNIGAQMQIIVGAAGASWVGFSFAGLPLPVHVALALVGGLAGGALAGFIPGALRAGTGANEVILTLMLNYVAANLLDYLITDTFFQSRTGTVDTPQGRLMTASATLPLLFGSWPVNAGLIVAIVVVGFATVFFRRSWLGFVFQVTGENSNAARLAGIRRNSVYIGAFVLSGALCGLAGSVQLLGVDKQLQSGFGASLGGLVILVAFVGNSTPLGITLVGLLYGALQTGALRMQFDSGISFQVSTVIQSFVVLFASSPALIAGLYRLRPKTFDQLGVE